MDNIKEINDIKESLHNKSRFFAEIIQKTIFIADLRMERDKMKVLTQREADTLREIEKYLVNPASVQLPKRRETKLYPLWYQRDERRNDDMNLSAFRGNKNPKKVSFRLLYAQCIILVRIDTQDPTPHINPDGTRIEPLEPHIHIYKEGYNDKFAYPLPKEFDQTDNIIELFMDFLAYSHVINRNQVYIVEPEVLFDD